MQSLVSLSIPPSFPSTPLQSQLLSTPKFSKSRQYKSKSTLSHYPSLIQPPSHSSNLLSPHPNLSSVFQQAKQFIHNVDNKISQFKRFNQNKITMRYQYLIKTMQKQISILKTRLAYEENSKNPTKQYMKGLLDQLLVYKKQNQKLKEEIKRYVGVVKANQKEIKDNKIGIISLETSLKGKVERLPSINYSTSSVSELISKFIEQKANISELLNISSQQTKLEKYLKEVQKGKKGWDGVKLLVEIDKWVEGECGGKVKEEKNGEQVDIWKVRYAAIERLGRGRGESMTPAPTPRGEKNGDGRGKGGSVDDKGRGSMKEQRVETYGKDGSTRYEKPGLRKLKEKVLSNFSSRKLSRQQKLY